MAKGKSTKAQAASKREPEGIVDKSSEEASEESENVSNANSVESSEEDNSSTTGGANGGKTADEDEEANSGSSGEESDDGQNNETGEEPREANSANSSKKQNRDQKDKKKLIVTTADYEDAGLDEGGRTVYVSGLPFDFKRKDLQDLFEKQGAMVTYIHMPVFEDSKRCRGFAQVTFTKREYVDVACEMDGSKLKGGRWLSVKRLDKSKVKKNKGKKAKSKQATEKDETAENDNKASGAVDRKRRYAERPDGCNKVYVGNIPMDAKESEVRDLFQRCGKIKSLSLGKDKKTGKFRGFAFVEFEPNPEDEPAEKAFTLSGKVRIHAKKLLIDYAPDTVVCYKCKSKNHYRGECPLLNKGKKLKLDTEDE